MERRIVAAVLVALGAALNWGIGWGLIAAGVGVAVSGVQLPDWRTAFARAHARARAVIAALDHDPVPRRTWSIVLVGVGVVALIGTGVAFGGTAGGLAGAAVGGIGTGAALGRE